MNNRKKLLAVMDIGSSKVSCLQTITDNNDITKVIGLSTIASKGVNAGIITDYNLATDSIGKALPAFTIHAFTPLFLTAEFNKLLGTIIFLFESIINIYKIF